MCAAGRFSSLRRRRRLVLVLVLVLAAVTVQIQVCVLVLAPTSPPLRWYTHRHTWRT